MSTTQFDIAIIGGGPAGLAAATYAINAHLKSVLIAPNLGGKVSYKFSLSDLPPRDTAWGADLVRQFENFVRTNLTRYIQGTVTKIVKETDGRFTIALDSNDVDGSKEADSPIHATTVIVATGVESQRLYISGEGEFWGRGVSFSAISHTPLYHGRDVAVVGRGKRALIAALRLGAIAKHVYLIPTASLNTSDARLQQINDQATISILSGWSLLKILGTNCVSKIIINKGYSTRELEVDGVFIEMGLIPNQEFLRGLLEFNPETGKIPINQRCETALSGLYAAGDVTDAASEQVPVAIGEGIKAALSAWEYLALATP